MIITCPKYSSYQLHFTDKETEAQRVSLSREFPSGLSETVGNETGHIAMGQRDQQASDKPVSLTPTLSRWLTQRESTGK